MNDLVKEFKEALKKMSKKELKLLEKKCSKYKGIGPTVEEYLENFDKNYNDIFDKENNV